MRVIVFGSVSEQDLDDLGRTGDHPTTQVPTGLKFVQLTDERILAALSACDNQTETLAALPFVSKEVLTSIKRAVGRSADGLVLNHHDLLVSTLSTAERELVRQRLIAILAVTMLCGNPERRLAYMINGRDIHALTIYAVQLMATQQLAALPAPA